MIHKYINSHLLQIDHTKKQKTERILKTLDTKKISNNYESESYKENKHYNSQATFKEQIYKILDSTVLATTPTPSINLKAEIESSATSLFDAVLNKSKSSSNQIRSCLSMNHLFFFVSILSIIINKIE